MYPPTTQAPERESEQVIGVLTGIVQKGPDKWQAVVMPDGSQYAKNLWTKDQQLVVQLSAMIGQRVAFDCNVSHWTRQDGQPVRSLWINVPGAPVPGSPALAGPGYVDQGTAPPPAQAPLPMVQVTPTVTEHVSGDVREARIHRQTASKVAAILLSHLNPEQRNMSTLLTLSERLVAYYDHGLPPHPETVEDLLNRAAPQGIDSDPGPDPSQPWAGDDDIPF